MKEYQEYKMINNYITSYIHTDPRMRIVTTTSAVEPGDFKKQRRNLSKKKKHVAYRKQKHRVSVITFVTEQPSPVLLTDTLPLLHTRAVNAAWVRHTLVTQRTLPAVTTPAAKHTHTHTQQVFRVVLLWKKLKLNTQ